MIWGLIALTLYLLRKFRTDHEYQVLDKKSENERASFSSELHEFGNSLNDFYFYQKYHHIN